MSRYGLITFLAVALWGCGGNDNTDTGDGGSETTYDGEATVNADFMVNGHAEECAITLYGPEDITVSGMTSQSLTVPAWNESETYVYQFGSTDDLGCDDQPLHRSGEDAYMALDGEVELETGMTKAIAAIAFPYYEWNGRLQCVAYNDYGWSFDYDPVGDDVTCISHSGKLAIVGVNVDFSSGWPIIGDQTVTEFKADDNGLSLTWVSDSSSTDIVYVDCVVD